MQRLFISLYILILATAFSFAFLLNPTVKLAIRGSITNYSFENFRGTIHLLDQQLKNAADGAQELDRIKKLFLYDIELIKLSDLSLPEKQVQKLRDGQATIAEIEGADHLYYLSTSLTQHVWRLQLDPVKSNENHQLVIGTVRLIETYFSAYPEPQWPNALENLKNHFGVSLTLINSNAEEILALDKKSLARLRQQQVIALNLNDDNELQYYQFANTSWVLKAGPISSPAIVGFLLPIIMLAVATLFALAIYLWMRPLWTNLKSIESASTMFGAGNFASRATISKLSPVKSISAAFNKMASHVQALISSHKDLTNAVSHELRTPLARMRFGLSMLSSAETQQDRDRFVNELNSDIDDLDTLISELLTYARFERSEPIISFNEVAIIPWLEHNIERAEKLSQDATICLHHAGINQAQMAHFEERLLSRALSNLLSNALRYAQSQVDVIIELTDEELILLIDDDGCGILSDKRDTIFEPFKRADSSRNRETGGFGIGLAIVKQVIEWHSGSIEIDDSPLGGARFKLKIPQKNTMIQKANNSRRLIQSATNSPQQSNGG